MARPVILWFRRDLRLADNPALATAVASGAPVLPVFVLDDGPDVGRPLGAAARWWLHHGLRHLSADLEAAGSRLLLRRGGAADIIPALAAEVGATAVFSNRRHEPAAARRDDAVFAALRRAGVAVEAHRAFLLSDPAATLSRSGTPYRVFTPYWNALKADLNPPPPLPAPRRLTPPAAWPGGDALDDWHLLPSRPDWAGGLREAWDGGAGASQDGARRRLDSFVSDTLDGYATRRDDMGAAGTSRLSPHLQCGQVGPAQIWHAVAPAPMPDGAALLRELGWREFAWHILHHNPDLAARPLDARFAAFPWQPDETLLHAWQRGRTGYPIVDAAMRELWHTGHMHNRARMVVASFLVKHLMQPWQAGEAWFWDTLVDADPASNPFNWQWVAGCGADAAPFFRIFNPVLQGRKFDPAGRYVRRWLPELSRLPDRFIHAPWEASPLELSAAGLTLGRNYPEPVVDHGAARERALSAFKSLSGTA